ncbi:hypothetical protein M5689_001809 [Euphorbia peplus]|nr:hypothetical protein M5689_001809 [Euphorbia peplus]
MSEPSSKVKLKLLIDKKKQKVLFAEADKDFVDFLFSIISLPLGKIVNLLTKDHMIGCIGNLYDSIASLSETYIQSPQNVESILNPKSMVSSQNPLLLLEGRKELYMCLYLGDRCRKCYNLETTFHRHVADNPNTDCPSCKRTMTCKLQFVESGSGGAKKVASGSGGGYVEGGVATYMVMDNLEVKPMSTISSVSKLTNLFNIKDLTSLEEKVVDVGVEEGSRILRTSLQSKDVLTKVFLCNYVEKKPTQKRASECFF